MFLFWVFTFRVMDLSIKIKTQTVLHKFMFQKWMGSTIILTCHKRTYQPTSSIDFGLVVTSCWRFRVFALREKKHEQVFYDLGAEKACFCVLKT
jgi:hypothetical protein